MAPPTPSPIRRAASASPASTSRTGRASEHPRSIGEPNAHENNKAKSYKLSASSHCE
uniref:Uncharacterized protein n=1 Tax=Triticum urartu TaxID=4572 RepID=A0A8R7TE37_TRIUA